MCVGAEAGYPRNSRGTASSLRLAVTAPGTSHSVGVTRIDDVSGM